MIARIWHGVTDAAKSEDYLNYLSQIGVADYRATEGNLGVYVLRRFENEEAHFLTVSFWASMERVKAFAGTDPERARYYPEDKTFLLDLEPLVKHYEVVSEQLPLRRP